MTAIGRVAQQWHMRLLHRSQHSHVLGELGSGVQDQTHEGRIFMGCTTSPWAGLSIPAPRAAVCRQSKDLCTWSWAWCTALVLLSTCIDLSWNNQQEPLCWHRDPEGKDQCLQRAQGMAALPEHKRFWGADGFQSISFSRSNSTLTFAPLNYFYNILSTQMAFSPFFCFALSEAYWNFVCNLLGSQKQIVKRRYVPLIPSTVNRGGSSWCNTDRKSPVHVRQVLWGS